MVISIFVFISTANCISLRLVVVVAGVVAVLFWGNASVGSCTKKINGKQTKNKAIKCLARHPHSALPLLLSLSVLPPSFFHFFLPATAAVVGKLIYATASFVFLLVFSVTLLRNRNKFIVCIFSPPPKASWPIKKMAKRGKMREEERKRGVAINKAKMCFWLG